MSKTIAIILGTIFVAALSACGNDPPPPAQAPVATNGDTAKPAAKPRKSDQDVSLSKNIKDVCKIDDSDRAPKFDFDSSDLSSDDREVLKQVAVCMTTGPLKGKSVELVGRADNRGEQEYNMTLGESRATKAIKFLVSLGVEQGRMKETSRGALDATGNDEEGWAKDRRVDVRIMP